MTSSIQNTTTTGAAMAELLRALILAVIRPLLAEGATLDEIVDGLGWARAFAFEDHEAAVIDTVIADLRAGRVEVRT